MPDARAAAAPPPMPSAPERAKEFMLFGRRVPAESLVAGLHVVSTPIGNLKDISIRALNALAAADVVLAEDTRVSGKLLSHYGVATPMISYHDHNAARMRPQVMERLARGEAIALISDAGTPLVSDPGYRLDSRRVRPACGAGDRGPADRPLFLRGLPAPQKRRPPRAPESAGGDSRHAGSL